MNTGHGTKITTVDPQDFMTGEDFQELASDAAQRLATALAAIPTR